MNNFQKPQLLRNHNFLSCYHKLKYFIAVTTIIRVIIYSAQDYVMICYVKLLVRRLTYLKIKYQINHYTWITIYMLM